MVLFLSFLHFNGNILASLFPAAVPSAAASRRRIPPIFRLRAAGQLVIQQRPVLEPQHDPPEPLFKPQPDPAHARCAPPRRTRSPWRKLLLCSLLFLFFSFYFICLMMLPKVINQFDKKREELVLFKLCLPAVQSHTHTILACKERERSLIKKRKEWMHLYGKTAH